MNVMEFAVFLARQEIKEFPRKVQKLVTDRLESGQLPNHYHYMHEG
jgi:hypothetical protein